MRLVSQIDHLRRRLQRRRLLAAACWAIAILVATALGLAACDRLLDVGDFLGRTLLTAAFACACFLVGRHAWSSVLNRPVGSMEIARRIESRHPKLHDMVTSALEFSQQAHNDPFAGSESLRRAVVIHTSVELEDIDWQQFVPRRPLRRAISAAAGALLVFGLLNWWAPQSLGIGLTRLLNPLSDSQWPGTQQLESVEAPPQIKNLQIKVHPPVYTGLPSRLLGKSGRVLARSGLQLSGECDQPLASVELQGERGQKIPATIDPANKQFHISPDLWRPKASGTFSLEFTTQNAVTCRATHPQRFTLNLIPDPPPQVKIQVPQNNLTVTLAAVVPLTISASDNLAIRDVKLAFSRSDRPDQPEQSILLFQGTKFQGPQQQQLEYLWQLQPLLLHPGTVLEVHARASDYQPSEGQTLHPLRLLVVSEKDLLREISEKDIQLLTFLKQLHNEQSKLHQLVTQWDQDQRWPEAFREVSSRQRRITTALTHPRDGILYALEELLDTYARNQLDRQAAVEQLQVLHERLSDLVENPLKDIQRLLSELKRKSQPPDTPTLATLAERQQTVIKTLQQVIDSLSIENELAKFESALAQIEARQRELASISQREILNDQPQADKQASLDQNQLSRQFAKLVLQMSRAMKNQSINSGSLSDTVSLARDLGVQTTMRAAANHLAQQQIGKASALQQASIDHLRQLRERLVTPRAEPPKSSSPADPGDQPEGPGEAGTKPNPPSSPTRQNQNRSTEETTTQLINDLWGNLPQRQREQILQPLSESYLPKYAEAIEAYFRTLAEPTNTSEDSRPSGNGNVQSN